MKRNSHHTYEYAIIGAGLSGLIVAAHLSQFTDDIALIEANESVGGFNRTVSLPGVGPVNNGIRLLPYQPEYIESLALLEKLLDLPLVATIKESPPVTFENGAIRPFVGFGEKPPEFYSDLNYFCSSKHIELTLQPHQWPELLMAKFRGDFLPRSYVTKFCSAEGSSQSDIQYVIINGSKHLLARNFIFCGAIKDLNLLLPKGTLSARAQNRLNKETFWTALCLDIVHKDQITETQSIHVLNGTTQDDIGPCVGCFLPLAPQTHSALPDQKEAVDEASGEILGSHLADPRPQGSQWITFVDEFTSEDSEVVANALKKIKRQIKRAYPSAIEGIKHERIVVAPGISGNGGLKLTPHLTLTNVPNLYIASGAGSTDRVNLWATLQQAAKLLSHFEKIHSLLAPSSVSETDRHSMDIENSVMDITS